MKYLLSEKICQKILTDNLFSLKLSEYLGKKQDTVRRLVKRNSDILRLPEQVAFYESHGFTRDEIFIIEDEYNKKNTSDN